jgi:NADH-quinone oxidoreductase subunit G
MVNLTIDGVEISAAQNTSILEAAKSVNIDIPTLCYLKDLNEVGACRICMVEIEGDDRLSAACNTPVAEGLVIHTNSTRVIEARKVNIELTLAEHDYSCPVCVRNGNCSLQTLASDLSIVEQPYERHIRAPRWDKAFPLIRDSSRCVKCWRCVSVCDKVQSLGVWDIKRLGNRATVGVAAGATIAQSNCSLCGQCITHCPTGALKERDDTEKVMDAIADPDTVVLVQIAPAVRAAWSEGVGLKKEKATVGRLVAAVRRLGVDYVFDTDFSADLTIMEEGSELLEYLQKGEKYPMFTSCCPGWVRFLKSEYPQLTDNLSTAKSPQQMFGAVAKTYFAGKAGIDPKKIFCLSIMPCLAKKHECALPQMNDAGAGQDVDVVITTRELDRLLRLCHVDVASLDEEEFDKPLGISTGAGVIFGATGGVMEAALRSAYFLVTGTNPDPDAFSGVRSMEGWREATYTIANTPVRIAIANGLGNTRKLIEAVLRGDAAYDFVEIMACPGGCVGGGGQPIEDGYEHAGDRAPILYSIDKSMALRFSHENPAVLELYSEFLGKPLSHRAHELLHTDHHAWEMPSSQRPVTVEV